MPLYEIRVEGILDPHWSDWLEGMKVIPFENGETLLTGHITDQSALYGLLNRLRDLNLSLVMVERKAELQELPANP